MNLFWRCGYQDTSLADLTEALGISSPSLYAAFGSKAELFCEAADLYQGVVSSAPSRALESGVTARQSVEEMLCSNAALFTRRGGPKGCLLTLAASTCPTYDAAVRSYVERSCRARLTAIEARLHRGAAEGEAMPQAGVRAAAEFFDTIVQGMAVRAREGASRSSLLATAALAMATWPEE